MVLEHHRFSGYRREPRSLVEPFRRVDWVDVSRGLVTFGVSCTVQREIYAIWPSAGFHKQSRPIGVSRDCARIPGIRCR